MVTKVVKGLKRAASRTPPPPKRSPGRSESDEVSYAASSSSASTVASTSSSSPVASSRNKVEAEDVPWPSAQKWVPFEERSNPPPSSPTSSDVPSWLALTPLAERPTDLLLEEEEEEEEQDEEVEVEITEVPLPSSWPGPPSTWPGPSVPAGGGSMMVQVATMAAGGGKGQRSILDYFSPRGAGGGGLKQ